MNTNTHTIRLIRFGYTKRKIEKICNVYIKKESTLMEYIVNSIYNKKPESYHEIINYIYEICGEVVTKNGYFIRYMKNIPDWIIFKALSHNGHNIKYIKDPSEKMCLIAVASNGRALSHIKRQTDEICLFAVLNDPHSLEFVKDKTENICLRAIRKFWGVINHVENPSDKLKLEVLKQHGFYIREIENPKEEHYVTAIKHNIKTAPLITVITEKIFDAMVENKILSIEV